VENNNNENQKGIILSRILKHLGFTGVDMDDFDNRLKYQKLIYLTQNIGVGLGYGYSWYVRGPYSPALTRTLFNIRDTPGLFNQGETITFKQEKEVVKRIDLLKAVLGTNFDDPTYLEVLASLHYLHKTLPPSENSCQHKKERLLTIKPDLKNIPDINKIIDLACKDLNKFN